VTGVAERAAAGAPAAARLSLNQGSVDHMSLREAVEGCARHGYPFIAPWRHRVAEVGLQAAARLVRDAGVSVSSLCRGGWFPAASSEDRQRRIDDNLRAVEEAAALGTDVLVLVCGPAAGRDIDGARAMVADGVAAVAPYAASCGVRLAVEPLHPMFAGDRSVVVTLAEALDLAQPYPPSMVGVIVDVYHVWWDPTVYVQIARAGDEGRIAGFHVSDWLAPPPDVLKGRGLMGDGLIELRRLRSAADEAGYDGPIEVEIFNQTLWDLPGDELLALMKERYLAYV
jgi:sugar phosphate isomerase/epimerase